MASKHVVVEKHFTVTGEEADELIEVAKKQNKSSAFAELLHSILITKY